MKFIARLINLAIDRGRERKVRQQVEIDRYLGMSDAEYNMRALKHERRRGLPPHVSIMSTTPSGRLRIEPVRPAMMAGFIAEDIDHIV